MSGKGPPVPAMSSWAEVPGYDWQVQWLRDIAPDIPNAPSPTHLEFGVEGSSGIWQCHAERFALPLLGGGESAQGRVGVQRPGQMMASGELLPRS